jgi:magnesium chelatase subunit H
VFEISGRMTAMIGWAATTGYSEEWVWQGAADRYVLDADMAERLKQYNPEACPGYNKHMKFSHKSTASVCSFRSAQML